MTVLQLAAINLILISLIVCQTLSYDVDSFFFIICQDIKRFYMSMTKLIINGLGCFFLPSSFMQTLYYFIAWLKIHNTISLAIVFNHYVCLYLFLLMDNWVIVKLTPSIYYLPFFNLIKGE